jgi:hypothetical protein|nr:hypothetical protein [Candidatus Acidoferrales bacterium]
MRWMIVVCALAGLAAMQDTAQQIHKQGKLEFPNGCAVDLDEGQVGFGGSAGVDGDGVNVVFLDDGVHESPLRANGDFKSSDFWFEGGKKRFLHPQHGTRFSSGAIAAEGFVACAKAVYVNRAIRIDKLSASAQICVHTSEGRYASIRITDYNPQTTRLHLTYTTWEK